jgi:hypothetical protein
MFADALSPGDSKAGRGRASAGVVGKREQRAWTKNPLARSLNLAISIHPLYIIFSVRWSHTPPQPITTLFQGRYELVSERLPGPPPSSTARPTRLTLATPAAGPLAGVPLVIFNAGDAVHVCRLAEVDQVR